MQFNVIFFNKDVNFNALDFQHILAILDKMINLFNF